METIILMGIRGSGKTSYARAKFPKHLRCSADEWFTDRHGKYKFLEDQLPIANGYCFRKYSLSVGRMDIVVDNENTRLWELSPYIALAENYSVFVKVVFLDVPLEIALNKAAHIPRDIIMEQYDQIQQSVAVWPTEFPTLERVSAGE